MKATFDARDLAMEVLARVERGGVPAVKALDELLARTHGLDDRDRSFVTELVYGVLRHRRRIDRVLQAFSRKRVSHPLLVRALRLAVYQILFLDRVPPRAAVHSAVEFVGKRMGRARAGFANALLRAFLREGEPLLPTPDQDPGGYLRYGASYSDWMAGLFERIVGPEEACALGDALNRRYRTVIRANTLKTSRKELQNMLQSEGVTATFCRYSPDGLYVDNLSDPTRHHLHEQGFFSVQEEASQLISHLLEPAKGDRILDVCGGSGGKTLHINALTGGTSSIVCCDSAEWRLRLASERFYRAAGESLDTRVVDWTAPEEFAAGEFFDRVLLDGPCTSIGALRRHPEAKWRLDAKSLESAANLQGRILEQTAKRVAHGGILVYAVCTVTFEEGPVQVQTFLKKHPEFSIDVGIDKRNVVQSFLDNKGRFFSLPHLHDMDGFFAVRLRRC